MISINKKGSVYVNVEKIPNKKISDIVVEQIEKLIESGTFQAGEKLPSVRELCNMFNVGRSAIRDAITTLKGKGTVYVKQGEGTFICKFDTTKLFNKPLLLPSCEDISELFQVRKLLEPGIAEMASIHRSKEDLQLMKKNIMLQSSNGWKSDYDFHIAIANAAGNQIIIQFMQLISFTTKKVMMEFHHYIQENDEMIKTIKEQHHNIFEAIKNRESKKANDSMIEHLNYVEELLKSSVLHAKIKS